MEKVNVKLKLSATPMSFDINLEELGLTDVEWNNLSEEKKIELVQPYIDDQNERERPYWIFEDMDLI